MSLLGGGLGPGAPGDAAPCSRAGCRTSATWQVVWRNPRIHSADRRKVWLACDEHNHYLRDYLAARDFPVELIPFAPDGPPAHTSAVTTEGA